LFASPIVGIWYWCTDQHIVHAALLAKTRRKQGAELFSPLYLKLMAVFHFHDPWIDRFFVSTAGNFNCLTLTRLFQTLVRDLLPVGLRWITGWWAPGGLDEFSGIVYNACSTLFTMDIYKK
jgi:SSS family solute:Na+ symporter